jgi:glucose-6-phosphate isomerase
MPLQQSIENARAEKIGTHGLSKSALDAALKRAESALDWVREAHDKSTLPLLRLPAKTSDLAEIEKAAARLRAGASDIVVLGVGGSSLGGQTLAQLAGVAVRGVEPFRDGPRVHFMDNLDPGTYGALLAKLPLATTRFIAISKSGGTGETLMQTAAALSAVKAAGLEGKIGELFFGISETAKPGKRNGLRDLLGPSVETLEHDPNVGGRYSGLTNTGLLPAAIIGLDIKALRAGAATALAPILAKKPAAEVPAALGAALSVAAGEAGKNIAVLMAYADKLAARRARTCRSALAASALHRGPARQAVHGAHRRHQGAGPILRSGAGEDRR